MKSHEQFIAEAENCLDRAYGDAFDQHEQDFWHDRALIFATLAVATKPSDGRI